MMQLFALQVGYGFILSSKWIPTARNEVADSISRPSRDAIIRIAPAAFRALLDEMGPSNVNLMACAASFLRSPVRGGTQPFFSQYDCAGSAGTDFLAQDVSIVPSTTAPAFGFCFRPRLWRLKAQALVLLPNVTAYWFQVVQVAAGRPMTVALMAA